MSDRSHDERPIPARKRPPAKPQTPGLTMHALLRKFVELSILAAVIGTVLATPLSLPHQLRTQLGTWVAELNGGTMPGITDISLAGFAADLLPIFTGALPIWEQRVGLFALIAIIGVGVHLCAKFYELLAHRPVFEDPSRAPRRDRNVWRRRLFLVSLIGLLCHAFLSYFWGDWQAHLPPIESYGAEMTFFATAQMPRALEGALILALAFAWFLAAEDAVRSRRFVYSLIALLILLGVVVAVVAIVLQRPAGSELISGALASAPLGAPSTWLPPFLLPPMLLAWTVLCIGRTGLLRWDRMGLALAIIVMFLALLEWADLPSLVVTISGFVLLIWLLRRRAGIEFSMASVVGIPLVLVALIGILVLTGDPPRAFQLSEFVEGDHVDGVPPVRLSLNDRMRVLFVSIPMVAENPVMGSGWGSFGYVYPEARARFFTLHPQTILAPAPFGLTHARSDFIQLLFEAGLFGAVFAIGGVIMLLSAGWASLRGCVRQEHVTIQLGIFVSILVLLTFALIESAFRIPSVVAMVLVMMAVWGNGERLWRLEVPRLEERVVGLADLPEEDHPAPIRTGLPARIPPAAIAAWSVCSLVVALGITFFTAVGGQWFSGRLLLAEGSIHLAEAANTSYPPLVRRDRLFAANGAFDLARRLQPQAGDVLFESARLQLAFAHDKLQEAANFDAEENPLATPAEVLRRLAYNDALQGLMLLEQAEHTVRGKELFATRAMLYDAAAQTGEGDSVDLSRDALRSLGHAVRLNPGDPRPVVTLVRWTRNSDVPTEQNMLDLYTFLYRFHPTEFKTHVLDYVHRLLALCDDAEAYREARRILSINPQDPQLRLLRAWTAFFAGDLGIANTEATALRTEGVSGAVFLDAMIAARESAYGRALADAVSVQTGTTEPVEAERLELFISALRTRTPATLDERRAALERLRAEVASRPQVAANLAHVLSSIFQDHTTARAIMREVVATPEAAEDPRAWAIMADVLVRSDSNATTLLRQLDRQPVGPTLPWERLRPAATGRARITEALRHLGTAIELSDSEADQLILRHRQRRLEALLPPPDRPGNAAPATGP